MNNKKTIVLSVAFIIASVLFVPMVNATTYTLNDYNSIFGINTVSGAYYWSVDGKNQLFNQWFWYRIGDTGGESSVGTLNLTSSTVTNNIAQLQYSGSSFDLTIIYVLTGGTSGSGLSDVAETVRIVNTTDSALDFHFFQYSDFDLNGTILGDTGQHVNANTVRQIGDNVVLSETVVTPAPNEWQIGYYPSIVNSLNDTLPTTLDNTNHITLAGDVTWAFEWDNNIAGDGSFIISKDKQIRPIPEPGTLLLLGSGLLGLGLLGRKKFRK